MPVTGRRDSLESGSVKIVVYHTYYGCDSGCCGHVVEADDRPGYRHTFGHPYGGDHLEFARECVREEFGEEHVADLDWANCLVCDD